MAEPLFGNTLIILVLGILGLLVLFVLVLVLYRYFHQLGRKINAAMLGNPSRPRPSIAQKYSHAHDPAVLKRRALEDKLLPKYGSKKTERIITRLINKKKNPRRSR